MIIYEDLMYLLHSEGFQPFPGVLSVTVKGATSIEENTNRITIVLLQLFFHNHSLCDKVNNDTPLLQMGSIGK